MLVKVTQEHVDKGKPKSYTECPIALALAEFTAEGTLPAYVCASGISLNNEVYRTPAAARRFISLFDSTGPKEVSPFEFELGEAIWLRSPLMPPS
jgi:hypothetical protein